MAHSLSGGASPFCSCSYPPCYTAGRATTPTTPPRIRRRVLASASPAPPPPAIEGRGLGFSVTTRRGLVQPVLKDCSLCIPPGQLWMLLGPNGCGKSTLLKVLAGFQNPSAGTVHINRPFSYVFQNPDHQVVMPTVESDVAFGLGKLNLSLDERPIQTLSGGQKQRVAIAGALAEASKVLLLDELTTFLDEYDQMGVIKVVRNSVTASGEVAALWVTHRLEELKYADGAIYMEDGRTVVQGNVASISRYIKWKQARYFGHFEL
ncbi:unnamed protein product [Alopecurus aequalis]